MDPQLTGRRWLERVIQKILSAIQDDHLLKLISKDQSTSHHAHQRLHQIFDYVYKADRETLIDKLVEENQDMKLKLHNIELRHKQELGQLTRETQEWRAKATQKNNEINHWKDQLDRKSKEYHTRTTALQNEVQCLTTENHKLAQKIEQNLTSSLYRSRVGISHTPTQAELLKLKEKLRQRKDEIIEWREKSKQDNHKLEESYGMIRQLQKNLKEQAYQSSKQREMLEFGHSQQIKMLKKTASQELQNTADCYRKEKQDFNHLTDEALQELTKTHRYQLERLNTASQSRIRHLHERLEILEKRNRQLQHGIVQEKNIKDSKRHPRYLVDEIGRVQCELAFKESEIITLHNQLTFLANDLSNRDCTIAKLEQDCQQKHAHILQLESQLEKQHGAHLLDNKLLQDRFTKREQQTAEELGGLTSQNQKLLDDLKTAETRSNVFENENQMLQEQLKNALDRKADVEMKQQQLTKKLMSAQSEANEQSLQITDLQQRLMNANITNEQILANEQFDQKMQLLQTERSQLSYQNQIIQSDFSELTRQYRSLFNSQRKLQAQNSTLKQSLLQTTSSLSRISKQTLYKDQEKDGYLFSLQETISRLQHNLESRESCLSGENQHLRYSLNKQSHLLEVERAGFAEFLNDLLQKFNRRHPSQSNHLVLQLEEEIQQALDKLGLEREDTKAGQRQVREAMANLEREIQVQREVLRQQ